METMKRIIRYNDWQNDPLSDGNAGNGIMSRNDLVDPDKHSDNAFLSATCFGGLDAKVSGYAGVKKGSIWAQCGPTHDQQPVFSWKNAPKFCDSIPHEGQPEVFDFDWVGWNHGM
ncbi:phospholipase b-like 1 [Anaeramoeba flamelloides]|uniref:Phospholipase B-like n=1 Tax=Anaeramoeba flamelloides TaxID=1746091 RepID=A0ABQ8YRV9_9EUKA|nr:phospholipase b-like 1 [Anaeramoeba flamelloides]